MARIRSLLTRVEFDKAKRAHKCQANSQHRIEKGELRLNVKNGRNWDRYCLPCADAILDQATKKLGNIRQLLEEYTVKETGELG